MGWSIGFDENWNRDIGYGVPSECDHPECLAEIDRGLSYVCGSDPYGGEHGCGLFFCEKHLFFKDVENRRAIKTEDRISVFLCDNCYEGKEPFKPKPDVKEWINHKLTDESWQQWREENPEEVKRLQGLIAVVIDEATPVDKSIFDAIEKIAPQQKISRFETDFVEFMPEEFQPGVLYISEKYSIAIHLCACGCRHKTVTPLGSPDGWQISIEDDLVTLHPSIGNWQFPCRSHYWIVKNEVKWA